MPGEFPPFDPHTPNPARMYNYWLGGHNNYEADRRRGDEIERWYPTIRRMAQNNRAFIGRAVTYAATSWYGRDAIGQYIDLGSGLPTQDCVHVTARSVNPRARVAYVDYDVEVCDQADLILDKDGRDGLAVVCADLRDPAGVLAAPGLRAVIDISQPACVLLTLVLQFMPAARAREVVAGYVRRLAPGSLIVISVSRNDDPVSFQHVRALWPHGELYNHTREEIASFFGDLLELVPPGVVSAGGWRGGWQHARVTPPGPTYVLAGVGRKPLRGQRDDHAQGTALRSTRTRAAAISAS